MVAFGPEKFMSFLFQVHHFGLGLNICVLGPGWRGCTSAHFWALFCASSMAQNGLEDDRQNSLRLFDALYDGGDSMNTSFFMLSRWYFLKARLIHDDCCYLGSYYWPWVRISWVQRVEEWRNCCMSLCWFEAFSKPVKGQWRHKVLFSY